MGCFNEKIFKKCLYYSPIVVIVPISFDFHFPCVPFDVWLFKAYTEVCDDLSKTPSPERTTIFRIIKVKLISYNWCIILRIQIILFPAFLITYFITSFDVRNLISNYSNTEQYKLWKITDQDVVLHNWQQTNLQCRIF